MACALMLLASVHNMVESMLDMLLATGAQDEVVHTLWLGSFQQVCVCHRSSFALSSHRALQSMLLPSPLVMHYLVYLW